MEQRTNEKQRYSINDVGLYDAEPLAQNNSSSLEALSFAGGANNQNNYGSGSYLATMNNLAQDCPGEQQSGDHTHLDWPADGV